jgi:hypothetical protein
LPKGTNADARPNRCSRAVHHIIALSRTCLFVKYKNIKGVPFVPLGDYLPGCCAACKDGNTTGESVSGEEFFDCDFQKVTIICYKLLVIAYI